MVKGLLFQYLDPPHLAEVVAKRCPIISFSGGHCAAMSLSIPSQFLVHCRCGRPLGTPIFVPDNACQDLLHIVGRDTLGHEPGCTEASFALYPFIFLDGLLLLDDIYPPARCSPSSMTILAVSSPIYRAATSRSTVRSGDFPLSAGPRTDHRAWNSAFRFR